MRMGGWKDMGCAGEGISIHCIFVSCTTSPMFLLIGGYFPYSPALEGIYKTAVLRLAGPNLV